MQTRCSIPLLALCVATVCACGGSDAPPPRAPSQTTSSKATAPAPAPGAHPLCGTPIASPAEVWPRIEAVRKLPDAAFNEHCGLAFIELVGYWRCPPVDILSRVVAHEGEDEASLIEWVGNKVETDSKLARHVVAMDIISRWELGAGTDAMLERAAMWKTAAEGNERITNVAESAERLAELLPKVTRVHELRCMLEVNPLGFAVACQPIHKQGQNIKLNWKAKSQDGLLQSLELASCKGSPACKKLKKHTKELWGLYSSLMQQVEHIREDVYKAQMKEWLTLRPFD